MKLQPWMIMIFVAGILLGVPVGYAVGRFHGNEEIYANLHEARMTNIEPLLLNPAYVDVTINRTSTGGVFLSGAVTTQEDLDRLRDQLTALYGEEGREMVGIVEIATPSPGKPDSSE